ncbi:MAG: DUF5908 family protein [Adhaeribacter sp.]
MPIEIRELHIKVIIDPSNTPASNAGSSAGTGSSGSSNGESDRDSLIAECVEQVMSILREKNER